MTGKLKTKGNIMLATKLDGLLRSQVSRIIYELNSPYSLNPQGAKAKL